MTGDLKSGFVFTVADDIGDDYEVLELIAEVEENPVKVTKLMRYILGAEQTDALKNHLRNENGRVTITAMDGAMQEIFNAVNALKNS